MLWAARLAGFLLFRVLKTGSKHHVRREFEWQFDGLCLSNSGDNRFDDIRSHFFKFAGFWVGQILWVWVVCESSGYGFTRLRLQTDHLHLIALPVVILNSPAVSNYYSGGDTDFNRSRNNPAFGTGRDIAGIILWVLGFVVESWADIAKVSPCSSHGSSEFRRLMWGVSSVVVLAQEQEPAQEPTLHRSGLGLVQAPAILWGDHLAVGNLDLVSYVDLR